MTITWEWRGGFTNDEVNRLHAEGFEHAYFDDDWNGMLSRLSLGWVVARDDDGLVGFVNVIWDGQIHAFIEDTLVAGRVRHQGVGKRLIAVATEEARAAGCEWLHVDFDDELKAFYFGACGFRPTNAGLIQLR
ncbi:GNAT family N-acetyltransferase [Leifsonia poae]|uniref:GNAT family N-acetyltransferase n=1 Tax=Leifsonia poae TaxID=110933 RepID=UPI001CBF48A8|nr:GNAT family N-acetyltransferase [Leifsonia poae]